MLNASEQHEPFHAASYIQGETEHDASKTQANTEHHRPINASENRPRSDTDESDEIDDTVHYIAAIDAGLSLNKYNWHRDQTRLSNPTPIRNKKVGYKRGCQIDYIGIQYCTTRYYPVIIFFHGIDSVVIVLHIRCCYRYSLETLINFKNTPLCP